MAIQYPEPLGDDGNIHIHAAGSFVGAPFMMREAGKVIDISVMPLFFEIPAINFRRAFTAHPTDAKARWMPAMTKAECANIADGMAYIIFDESSGQPVDIFGGKVRRYS